MQPKADVTATLARFVAGTKAEQIPEAARHAAKRALLNFFAVAFAGCRTEPVELALKTLAQFSGGTPATVVGRGERIDALSAAFLNAAGANVFDYCDTHLPTVVHPTAPLAPALLALAELRKVSGSDLLTAFVLGFEIECRVGLTVSPGHYPKGWHITSTCGVFGAAAGAARLLGLSPQQIVWALGSASTQSAGLCECLGWPAKSVSVGNAARNGLLSALLAEKGFSGPPEPIAGAQGWIAAMGEPPNYDRLTGKLGENWEVLDNSLKPYPSGFVIHPLLDVALDWRKANPGATVERMAFRGNPLLSQRTDRPHPATGREAQVSLQHAVACALLLGKADLAEFTDERVNDPRIKDLRGRITVAADPAISTIAVEADIFTADGKKHHVSTKAARGSSANPQKDSEIEQKLKDEAKSWSASYNAQPLIDAVWALDRSSDVSNLLALTRP